jgi:pSer/pThr/pTyr-binding forkhead associated (FHA) protein
MRAMRAIVEIRFGPHQGKKALLEPGRTLRLGRALPADLVVPSDSQMSDLHCELAWDGARCRVRDLDSAKGTWINGEIVAAGEAKHGAWIRAGDTVAMIYVEESTPPRRGADVEMTEVKARALAALSNEKEPLFAVLDAARSERILEVLRESAEPYRSLYEGLPAEGLAHVAPYLVGLPKGARLLERLVREGWGKRWGIYLTSKRPFKEVRTHLRRFLMVENEETRERMYFRFYDPPALLTFLRSCSARQRAEVFDDVECFRAEGKDGVAIRSTVAGGP